MDDRLRETLSAMMDDEADELSVRRLLSCSDQDKIRGQWQRWQHVHDLMHNHSVVAEPVSPSLNVSAGVWQRVDGHVAATANAKTPSAWSWHWPAVAMVTMALAVGFGAGSGWQSSAGAAPELAQVPAIVSSLDATTRMSNAAAPVNEVSLQGLDEQQWQQVQRYLLEHAQHNSVGAGRGAVGYARMVSADAGGY